MGSGTVLMGQPCFRPLMFGAGVEYGDYVPLWYFNGRWLGYEDEGFWALWELLTPEERSDWKLLQWAPWVKS